MATCDARDEWSEKVGINIVDSKLAWKNHMSLLRKYRSIRKTLLRIIAKIDRVAEIHYKKAKAIKEDLENYYGGES